MSIIQATPKKLKKLPTFFKSTLEVLKQRCLIASLMERKLSELVFEWLTLFLIIFKEVLILITEFRSYTKVVNLFLILEEPQG